MDLKTLPANFSVTEADYLDRLFRELPAAAEYLEPSPGVFYESYSPISSSGSLTQLGQTTEYSTKDELSLFKRQGGRIDERIRQILLIFSQKSDVATNVPFIQLGLPVLYYPDIEVLEQVLRQHKTTSALRRRRFGYRAACCIGFISDQHQVDQAVLTFAQGCESFKRNAVSLSTAIITTRINIYSLLEAISIFRFVLIKMCLSIRKLHQQAREQSLNKIGYLKNTSFIRKCRRIKENVVLMENAKHELYSIVDEIQADLKDINEVTRALGGLQNQWNKAQNMFEKHHDKYSDQVYLMETYTYPLWHYFDHAARILDTDSWKIFSEFAQAEKQFKKDTAIAEDTLQEAVEHIMWGKLALLKIDCYTKDCDVWVLGDEIPVVT